ncbi:MAG: hypothetical protein ACYDH5_08420 [Acidimicrobiales bacterium]
MRSADVLQAAESCRELLRPAVNASWAVRVPGLEMTVAHVVAHAANGPLWYALDLWSGPGDDAAFEVPVGSDAGTAAILLSMPTAARVCAASLDAAPGEIRGFHPAGSPDPSGFAAMACDELLVHADDAARGLGLGFSPDSVLAARVLTRLFPWHELGGDPWRTLLWANGRIDPPGRPHQRPHQRGWHRHCAPLAEWDGRQPGLG